MDKKELSGLAPHPPKRLVIDRSRWLRAPLAGSASMLFRPSDGKMCCIGFYGRACGYSEHDMAGNGFPWALSYTARWPRWLMESSGAIPLTDVNDAPTLSAADREAKIAAIFAENGVEVVFVDGPVADSDEVTESLPVACSGFVQLGEYASICGRRLARPGGETGLSFWCGATPAEHAKQAAAVADSAEGEKP